MTQKLTGPVRQRGFIFMRTRHWVGLIIGLALLGWTAIEFLLWVLRRISIGWGA